MKSKNTWKAWNDSLANITATTTFVKGLGQSRIFKISKFYLTYRALKSLKVLHQLVEQWQKCTIHYSVVSFDENVYLFCEECI